MTEHCDHTIMLMSDTWQPAVLHLLPFSTNDACNPRPPSSARLTSLPTPDHSRGFPVLAVTRRVKDGGGGVVSPGGFPTGNRMASQHRSAPARASSERLPRTQTQIDSPLSTSRAKSDYHDRRRNKRGVPAPREGFGPTRDPQTCSITDINERIISRMVGRADSGSPDSGSGGQNNSPLASATPEVFGNSGPQGLPKPAILSNGIPHNGANLGLNSEGRYLVSGKNGLWRSITMTPGELELRKHREHLDRAQTMRSRGDESKVGKRYKLNVKDLPRSNTPVNDHDPDKLNMKQVIAFLQSKGKSQADAVELPRDLSAHASSSGFRRSIKSSVMRGKFHRNQASSSTVEIAARVTKKNQDPPADISPKTSPTTVKIKDLSDKPRATTSLPSARNLGSKDRHTSHSHRAYPRDPHSDYSDLEYETSPRKAERPFRLHRFLTMVQSQTEPPVPTNKPQEPSNSYPLAPRFESHFAKSSLHERTLCLDLAAQSKGQATHSPKGIHQDNGSSENRVQFRIPANRPSSLRVEQDENESEWKLSADFGGREETVFSPNEVREEKTVIRLPHMQVDSEDEDASFIENRRHAKPQSPKLEKESKQKQRAKKSAENKSDRKTNPKALTDKESLPVNSTPEVTASSSTIQTSTKSNASLTSQSDVINDAVNESDAREESVNSTSVDIGSDNQPAAKQVQVSLPRHSREGQGQRQGQKQKPAPKQVECVTLSLRKERNRTREKTYMSEIGGSDVFSDDTVAARVNSESVRLSVRSDDALSWLS